MGWVGRREPPAWSASHGAATGALARNVLHTMRTLGIDLAVQPQNTAACAIDWSTTPPTVTPPELNLTDADLTIRIHASDKAAIDAPFGWPDEFVAAVSDYADTGRFTTTERARLRFRETDRAVAEERLPLSVSSDRIAVTAMRCAALLTQLSEQGLDVDRAGFGRVVEVYPAAALVRLGIEPRGYKAKDAHEARQAVTERLVAESGGALVLEPAVVEACVATDHALDALIAALVARAAALEGRADGPPAELVEQAQREGWIWLPRAGGLAGVLCG